ncbi:hypothetical protein PF002_g25271 [Phytophthora fragariae]|uniref:Uncharacterized protein n=1 Tax=Phytophthora fragariae TaxID=53985 RepID=A0A6A3WP59_9STRA|nr:hypothetical protein PF002_g25271 [Phytophthora fragariae]
MKGRFIVNPFQELNLTAADRTSLEDLANQCILTNLRHCMKYTSGSTRSVDPNHWKPLKEKERLRVFSERSQGAAAAAASGDEPTGSGLPMILSVDCAKALLLKNNTISHSSFESSSGSVEHSSSGMK